MENNRNGTVRRRIAAAVLLVGIPAVILLGVLLLEQKQYAILSLAVAGLSCVPFFLRFEKKNRNVREIVTVAVMTALSVAGRMVFAPLPFFKPVSAIVVITGIAFGPEPGFITGSLTAILSNLYFGQGPWTPFQMFIWGILGFLAGVLFRRGKNPGIVRLCLTGVLAGALFSLGMDIWTTFSFDGAFSLSRYLFFVASAVPVTACYAVSNVLFLLLLTEPILKKTERLRKKYGVFED